MRKVNNLFNAGYGWGRTYPLKTRLKEEPIDYSKEYMYIEALEDGMTVSFTKNATSGSLYYSLDKQEWNELTEEMPAINSGEKIYFKGDLVPASNNGIGTFVINKQCNVAGNIISLLFADEFIGQTDLTGKDYAFYRLFRNCTIIQSAKNLMLHATTLARSCYRDMFYGCTSFTTAPELPATKMVSECYYGMFQDCTSLTSTPELPATTLANNCYNSMFQGCTGLTIVPELPATTLAQYCYNNMFRGCTSLISTPELPATSLALDCYTSMFNGCTSLTTISKIHSRFVSLNCYQYMFSNCTSLTEAPELPATSLQSYCYRGMFSGCTSLTKAPELPAKTLKTGCYESMFSGCTSLVTSPELPATSLAKYCYRNMFSNTNVLPDCSNIDFYSNEVVASGGLYGLFAHTKVTDEDLYNILPVNENDEYYLPCLQLAEQCYYEMFRNCKLLNTAPVLPATTLVKECYFQMFMDSNVNYVKALFTTTPSYNYTGNWLRYVPDTGTFVKNSTATWTNTGSDSIPYTWTVQTA